MRDLLIITPTRGRPAGAQRLIGAVASTATAQTDLVFAVDDDDRSYDGLRLFPRLVRGPRKGVAAWTTQIALEQASHYRALASMSDDHVPITTGWDRRLLDALGGRMGVAYGDDLLRGKLVPTAAVISSPIVTALGYMTPPGVEHLYIDCFWKQLGEDLGCLEYLPDVIIEHCHPSAHKAEWDEGYERVNAPDQYARDKASYDWFLENQWPGDLARLRRSLSAGGDDEDQPGELPFPVPG